MKTPTPESYLHETFEESIESQRAFYRDNAAALIEGAKMMARVVKSGGKILICGNGGSAADAQGMAAELVGRMLVERRPLPAFALSTDTSVLTAIGNDYGYDVVFSKQVEALAKKEDILFAISTSGNSPNILRAVEAAKKIGATVIALTGGTGGKLKPLADLTLSVSEAKTAARVQESHIFAYHSLVDLLDRFYLEGTS